MSVNATANRANLIAHRGNVFGPRPEMENRPEHLQRALDMGFSIEVDIRLGTDGQLWAGHDAPLWPINPTFGSPERVYWHCKNTDTFLSFRSCCPPRSNYFLQENDGLAVTSQDEFWLHSSQSERPCYPGMIRTILGYRPEAATQGGRLCSDFVGWYAGPPKLLILDVDGVLTLAAKRYDAEHNPADKTFNDHDFTAIKRFRANGTGVVLLSGDRRINEPMAIARNIPFYFGRVEGRMAKAGVLVSIMEAYGVKPEETAYVGDDWYDLEAFAKVGYRFCSKDAIAEVRAVAHPLACPGGMGVVAELAALYSHFLTNPPEEKERISYG